MSNIGDPARPAGKGARPPWPPGSRSIQPSSRPHPPADGSRIWEAGRIGWQRPSGRAVGRCRPPTSPPVAAGRISARVESEARYGLSPLRRSLQHGQCRRQDLLLLHGVADCSMVIARSAQTSLATRDVALSATPTPQAARCLPPARRWSPLRSPRPCRFRRATPESAAR